MKVTAESNTLASLVSDLLDGRIRVIDLTQTLTPEFPQIVLPPEMGQCLPFRIEEVSRYDDRGPGWYWNNFSCGEHTGTHFDAPIHWISGRDLPDNAVDTIPVERLIGPACVIDCSAQSAADPDFLLTRAFVLDWEARHGRIPPRAWLLMRTDWSKRTDPEAYQNFDETGQHTPATAHPQGQLLLGTFPVLLVNLTPQGAAAIPGHAKIVSKVGHSTKGFGVSNQARRSLQNPRQIVCL
jgi:kynurenine formamidase